MIELRSFYNSGDNYIDLRKNFDDFMKKYGHWVVLRHFTSEKDISYDIKYDEAPVGMSFKYKDGLVRTRFVEYSIHGKKGEDISIQSLLEDPRVIFYMYHYIQVDRGDYIFLLKDPIGSSQKVPSLPKNFDSFIEKTFIVTAIDNIRGDIGRVEYKIVVTKGKL